MGIALALLALIAALAFVHLRSPGVVATLSSATPGVSRDFRGAEERWVSLPVGEALRIGDAVRTSEAGHAVLALEGGATMVLEPETVVRFLERAPDQGEVRVERGLAGVQTGEVGIQMETAYGLLTLSAHANVRVQQAGQSTYLRVDMGKASLIDPGQVPQALSPGDELFLEPNHAPRSTPPDNAAPAPFALKAPALLASAETEGAELEASADDDVDDVDEDRTETIDMRKLSLPAQPALADVSVRAGEQATVHDPGRSTNVRLFYEHACPKGEALVDVASMRGRFSPRAMSQSSAVIRVDAGASRYRVRCPSPQNGAWRVVASGQIRVVRDAAVRRVPTRPPTNAVDLDGRRYTVFYQNRLPAVVAHAPKGMHTGRMIVRSGSRLRTVEAAGGMATFSSGDLTDGAHAIFFESSDGRTRSEVTTLKIAFDNAAPVASIDQRGAVAPDGRGQVHLSGVVPLGSRVSFAGQALALDAGGRFVASAQPTQADAAVSLRVEHPRAGLHYYVRRIEGLGAAP